MPGHPGKEASRRCAARGRSDGTGCRAWKRLEGEGQDDAAGMAGAGSGRGAAMSGEERFDRILDALHAAVFDDALWPAASGLIDEALGSRGSMLAFGAGMNPEEVEIFFARFCYRGERRPDLERLYFGTYHALDEALPRARRVPVGQPTHIASFYTDDEKKTSLAYSEGLPLLQTQNGLGVRLDGPDGVRIGWTVADPVDGEGWSAHRVEAMRGLMPHLRQFFRVRQALVDARALGAAALELLGNDRLGVVQLDRRGRIIAANDRALAVLNARDGVRDEDGMLRAVRAAEDTRLQKLLARALPSPGGAGGSMLVTRREALPRFVLHVSPVAEGGPAPRGSRLGALVLVDDPSARTAVDPERLRAALDLTPAESRIAALLAEGRTIDAVAAATGTRRSTVTWHMRHIYEKLGLGRQTELMQLVASLADVRGAGPIR